MNGLQGVTSAVSTHVGRVLPIAPPSFANSSREDYLSKPSLSLSNSQMREAAKAENVRDRISSALAEHLFDASSYFKIYISSVSMHLRRNILSQLPRQVERILSYDNWEMGDSLPNRMSIRTLIRALVFLAPEKCPGLAMGGDGTFMMAWRVDDDTLAIECLPGDVLVVACCQVRGNKKLRAVIQTEDVQSALAELGPNKWFAANDSI